MKGWPVGTVVVLQHCLSMTELNESEATITAPLEVRHTTYNGEGVELEVYLTDLVHDGNNIAPQHYQTRLKRFPGQLQSWLREKMDNLLKPNEKLAPELSLEHVKEDVK